MSNRVAYTSNNEEMNKILAENGHALDSYSYATQKVSGSHFFSTGIDDISVRDDFGRSDYEDTRPKERLPKTFSDTVHACRRSYTYVNIVRQVIDLMTDFAVEDMKFVHPDKSTKALIDVWAEKVGIREAADEFVRHLLVDGNVVAKRTTAKLAKPTQKQWMKKLRAEPDIDRITKDKEPNKREIPWKYNFLNVASLEWRGGELAKLTGDRQLSFTLSKQLIREMVNPSADNADIVKNLPADFRKRIQQKSKNSSKMKIDIDMDKVFISHYKKDSWQDWGTPFLLSILPDLFFKDKLRLAETAALDGVINVIRLWKLGDHTEGIMPNEDAVDHLLNILKANTGGGAMDIVWDSLIEMQEFYPPIDEILGSQKYEQVNKDILIGLGVPEVLIGGQGGNFSNSWVQLKTLIERLQAIRNKLRDWLQNEVRLFCQGMGIKTLPKVKFSEINLQDENVTKRLIVGLLDRGIISVEAVHEAYGEDFTLEVDRIRREQQLFDKKGIEVRSPMASNAVNSPSGGVENPQNPANQESEENKDSGGGSETSPKENEGRPPGTEDTDRDERTPNPQPSADKIVFGLDAVDAIDKHVVPAIIDSYGVKNARQLSAKQKQEIESMRRYVLANIKPNDKLDSDSLLSIAENSGQTNKRLYNSIGRSIKNFTKNKGNEPTTSQKKRIEAVAWAHYYNDV